ncbi:MAG: DsbC family protein [Cardiobacteriaceae bacterium]|nr:DsbC family protein [Cardiobacteriaceae bacterium]
MLRHVLSLFLLLAASHAAVAEPNLDTVRDILRMEHAPSAHPTPVPGTYEFSVGNDIFYVSEDGRYLIKGEMIDLHTRQNLAEARRQQNRLQRLQHIPPDDMITFPARGERRHVVYVFMDTDCPYCRMVQQDIYQYSQQGIEMRFLAFPRGGLNSPGYQRAISIWCAEDRIGAMIAAQDGQPVPERKCPTSVREQYATGLQIGVTGTPAMVLEDGTLVQGFMAPPNLAQFLTNHFGR